MSTIEKRGKTYWVDVYLPLPTGGKTRFRKTTGQQDELLATHAAAQIIKDKQLELARGSVVAPVVVGLTLAQALKRTYDEVWSRSRNPKPQSRLVDLLVRQLGHYPMTEYTNQIATANCLAWMKEGIAPATVNRRMSSINLCYTIAIDEKRELTAADRPKLPKYKENNAKNTYMTVEEEVKMLAWFDDAASGRVIVPGSYTTNEEWTYLRNMTIVLLDTGLRFGELYDSALLQSTKLDVCLSKSDYGRRALPLTPRALIAVKAMFESPVHAMLKGLKAEKAKWDWCTWRWYVCRDACGISEEVKIHTLRHTNASRMINGGFDIFKLCKWLGHSSVKITQRYSHLFKSGFDGALAALAMDHKDAV